MCVTIDVWSLDKYLGLSIIYWWDCVYVFTKLVFLIESTGYFIYSGIASMDTMPVALLRV